MVADLVSNHISLRELAGFAPDVAGTEALLKVLKKACIEIDLLVDWTIERTHCGLRKPTARLCSPGEHDQRRGLISFTRMTKNVCPHFLCAAKDSRDESARIVRRCSGRTLLLLRLTTLGQLLRAANEETRIDAKCPSD